jgi:hypothetical protein
MCQSETTAKYSGVQLIHHKSNVGVHHCAIGAHFLPVCQTVVLRNPVYLIIQPMQRRQSAECLAVSECAMIRHLAPINPTEPAQVILPLISSSITR